MKLPEFVECDTCRAKLGTPTLCRGCLINRDSFHKYYDLVRNLIIELEHSQNLNKPLMEMFNGTS